MFAPFILELRRAGLPASITEWLMLMGAMRQQVAGTSVEDFYFLARSTLVKDERHLDRFDVVFGQVFKGSHPRPASPARSSRATCRPSGCASWPRSC
jgi:uncharacterized protein with von Willebrand factor type A (vWA) domain